ncbi:MAG: FAD:protein FMN transferase [Candidatus Aceula lacicola]|nr:FAD:protein FMN transferase [Candidatus Aceula lacicola]
MFSFRNNQIKFLGLFFVLILVSYYFFTQNHGVKITEQKLTLGTIVQIDICMPSGRADLARSAFKKVWHRIDEINICMNAYDERSDVFRINVSYPDFIEIHPDTYSLLKDAQKYSTMTNGAFDVTVGPLVLLWQKAGEAGTMPSQLEIEQEKEKVGFHNIEFLKDSKVRMLHPGTKIDLSAIAKGYAVDQAAQALRDAGINNFLINAGGDIFVSGKNCQNNEWSVGIQNPSQPEVLLDTLYVTNAAITTSGDYEQYHIIEQERYSHIIDPRTGYPARSVKSATVVAKSAEQADAFSTAFCVLGPKESISWVDQIDEDISILLIEKNEDEQIVQHMSRKYKNLHKTKH